MSTEEDKERHSKRLLQKENHINRQMKIRKAHKFTQDINNEIPHKYHKVSGTTCGISNCVMCGNPRKTWNESTIQEKSFDQTKQWVEEEI